MPRFALQIEYDGAPYAGWQRQPDQPSVQGEIEAALGRLDTGPEGAPILVQGAGRTDAGVHARGQVANVDLTKPWTPFRLSEALNAHLHKVPVSILAVAEVHKAFHARFSATERRYLYRILPSRVPPALDKGFVWQVRPGVDVAAMRAGAQHLIGEHDFTTFRSTICQAKSPTKTVDEIRIEEAGAEVHIHVRARSFLHNQVRSFVGTLAGLGREHWPPQRVREALEAKDRAACGPVAPPQGLYLMKVQYPDDPFQPVTPTPTN